MAQQPPSGVLLILPFPQSINHGRGSIRQGRRRDPPQDEAPPRRQLERSHARSHRQQD